MSLGRPTFQVTRQPRMRQGRGVLAFSCFFEPTQRLERPAARARASSTQESCAPKDHGVRRNVQFCRTTSRCMRQSQVNSPHIRIHTPRPCPIRPAHLRVSRPLTRAAAKMTTDGQPEPVSVVWLPRQRIDASRALHATDVPRRPRAQVFLVFGKSGWIGGLVGEILKQQGAKFEYATARMEDRAAILADVERVTNRCPCPPPRPPRRLQQRTIPLN